MVSRPFKGGLGCPIFEIRIRLAEAVTEKRAEKVAAVIGKWPDVDQVQVEQVERVEGRPPTRAAQFLADYMGDEPVYARKVQGVAKHLGFTEDELRGARNRLGIEARKMKGIFGAGGSWYWAYREWLWGRMGDLERDTTPLVPRHPVRGRQRGR